MFRKESRQTGGGPAPAPLKDWEEKVFNVYFLNCQFTLLL